MKKLITLIFGVEIFNLLLFDKLIDIDNEHSQAINNINKKLNSNKLKKVK